MSKIEKKCLARKGKQTSTENENENVITVRRLNYLENL